jgi:hypothetical protein
MSRSVLLSVLALAGLAGLAAGACATLGGGAGGSTGLPTANMGPFRELTMAEEPNQPLSFVFAPPGLAVREPSVLAVDPSDPSSMGVYLCAVVEASSDAGSSTTITRTRADDGRSFYGTALDPALGTTLPPVLSATAPWEGSRVTGPSVLRVGSEYYLFYAAAGGIGLARSADGLNFIKNDTNPVLAPDPTVSWETTPPSAPSVAQLPDGSFDMMYSAGVSIGEATSLDGITFTRHDADPDTPELDPVLSPLGSSGAVADGSTGPFDTGQVADPCVLPVVDPTGRLVVRVLYTGYDGPPKDATRSSAIGFAARYGMIGRLSRQPAPVFSLALHEAAPSYFAWAGGELVYVHADDAVTASTAVAAGIAPATVTLGKPEKYATMP